MALIDELLIGLDPIAGLGAGAGERVIGSGDSFPAFPGLVQYNGLLFNDYSNYDHYRIISIDGLDDAEIRDNRQPKPNADGENDYGAWYGGRPIVINGEIRSSHLWKYDDMRAALINAFARKDKLYPLWFRTGSAAKDRVILCRKNAKLEIPNTVPTKQQPVIPFMIPLRASDPRMLSFLKHNFTYTLGDALEFTITNAGNYEAKMLIRVAGPVTTLTLTRLYDNVLKTIVVTGIASGDYIDIEGSKIVDQDGANAYGNYSDDSEVMLLGPGPAVNGFNVSATGTGSGFGITFEWHHSWVG